MTSHPRTEPSLSSRITEVFAAVLLVAALISIQVLIGGTRLLFALPAYGLIAILGVSCLFVLRAAKPAPAATCLAAAGLFFGYILVRACFSPAAYLARMEACSVIAGVIVYLVVSCVLTSAKSRMIVLACLLVAALAHVLVGAMQFRAGNNYMPISFLQRFDYGERASGFYVCPNHLAGLLEVIGLFGLALVCWSRWPLWTKLLVGYATVLCYVGIVLTGSRGGYLSVAISLLVFVLMSLAILRAAGTTPLVRIGGAGLVIGLIALFATFWLVQKSDFLTDRARKVADQKNMRLQLWEAAIKQWKISPLLGTGSRTYLFYGRQFRDETVQGDPVYAHNDYLQLLSDYGLIGVGLFIPFFLTHWRQGLINARRLGPKRIVVSHRLSSNAMALNVAAVSSLGAYAVHSLFDFNLHIPANVLLLALVCGILTNSGVIYGGETAKPHPTLILGRCAAILLALALGYEVCRVAGGEYFAERARTAIRDYRPLMGIRFALKGLARRQDDPLLFYYLGRARTLAGDASRNPAVQSSFYTAALEPYGSARSLVPLDKTYPLELAFNYDSLRRFAEAEWMFGEALALDPKSTAVKRYYEAHLEKWGAPPPPPSQPETP